MAIANTFSRLQSRRRPLAPLAISRADGTSGAVRPPTQSRVPQGTMFSSVQGFRGAPSRSMLAQLRQSVQRPGATAAAPGPAANPLTAARLPLTRGGNPNIAPPAAAQPPAIAAVNPQRPVQDIRGPIQPGQARTADFQTGRPSTGLTLDRPPKIAPPAGGQPGQFGAQISDITGEERPQAIAPGQSVTNPLQEQAQAAASRALENPSPFDDELFKQEVERGREAIGGDIAERGLDYSTIAPEIFSRRVLQPLLSERARGIAGAREQALRGAQDVIGQRAGLEAQGRGELRGERGYTDELRERARQNEIQRYQLEEGQFQSTLQQALASGDPTRALAALQSGAYGLGGPAQAYGQQAEQSGEGLQDLAELFMQQFYGNQGQAA